MKSNTLITLLSSLGFAGAAGVFEPVITIESLNNTFNIHEYAVSHEYEYRIRQDQFTEAPEEYLPSTVYYQVDLLTNQSVYLVAISYKQDGTNGTNVSSSLQGSSYDWSSHLLSESDWNNSTKFTLGVSSTYTATSLSLDLTSQLVADMPLDGFMSLNTIVDTSELGSFDSLFGTEDDMVAVYVLGDRHYDNVNLLGGLSADMTMSSSLPLSEFNDIDEENWSESTSDFTFSRSFGLESSNAIILGLNGAIIGTSIPEPSTSLLAGLSALALVVRRRR